MDFLKDLFDYFRTHKKYWLIPLVGVFLLFGVLIALTGNAVMAPFFYALF